MVSGEQDFTKRMKGLIDIWWVKGVLLKDPTFANTLPVSVENDAIAYSAFYDRFKVQIDAWSAGTLTTDVSDKWARQLGQIDLYRVLGATLAHSNPVIVRLTNGSAFIDPTDVADRAARLVGRVYGSQGQQIQQRATTYELLVQLFNAGVEIDPRAIRTLTASDLVTAYGSLAALQQRATTQDLFVQIRSGGTEKDPTQIRSLAKASDAVEGAPSAAAAALADSATNTARQPADKDGNAVIIAAYQFFYDGATWDRARGTIAKGLYSDVKDISYVATVKQISETAFSGNSGAIWTPAGGKKIRLKFLSIELSAAVDLGFRFAAAGTIYYLRTSAGAYVANLVGSNIEGAVDEIFYLNSSGSCTVKGYVTGEEV